MTNPGKSNKFKGYSIIIIEDDEALQHLINKKLQIEGFKTVLVSKGADLLKMDLNNLSDTIILLDFLLPDINGKQIIEQLQVKEINIPFIIMTGHGDEQIAVEMMKLGARDYLVKEANFIELLIPVINQTVMQLELEKKLTLAVVSNREKDALMMMQSRQASMGEMISNFSYQWKYPLVEIEQILKSIAQDAENKALSSEKLNDYQKHIGIIIFELSQRINDLQDFFKPQEEKNYFFLDAAVKKAASFVKAAFMQYGINIEMHMSENVKVFGFENEYIQIILNLLNNSKDVLLKRQIISPWIKIFLKQKDNAAELTIIDNAGGVQENMIKKIFDPYFTTKTSEEGTGLGLYITKTFVEKELGGNISARNINDGLEFKIEVKYLE